MDYNSLHSGAFRSGILDYFYLINRNYPERGSLKLVGDRYRLNRDQRTILYRGVTSEEKADQRRKRLSTDIAGKHLIIDGYNVLFTLLNYRLGRIIFISNDHIVRDAGSLHGRLKEDIMFRESVDLLFVYFKHNRPGSVHFYIDSPVSQSVYHKQIIDEQILLAGLTGTCEIVKSPDQHIKKETEGIIITSDSVIIDKTDNQIVDLSHLILKSRFKIALFDLNEILNDLQQ